MYPQKRILTPDELTEITTMYQYQIPTRTIGLAFGLGYQKISKVISVIKLTNSQHPASKIKEDLKTKIDTPYDEIVHGGNWVQRIGASTPKEAENQRKKSMLQLETYKDSSK